MDPRCHDIRPGGASRQAVGLPCGHTDPPGCDGIHPGGLLDLLPGVTERELAGARRKVLWDLPAIYGDDQAVLL